MSEPFTLYKLIVLYMLEKIGFSAYQRTNFGIYS